MIDGSFTSEPQYQRPDNRVSDVDFVPKPPLVINYPVGVNTNRHYLATDFADLLFRRFGKGFWLLNRLDFYGNTIILGAICNALAFLTYGFYRCKVYKVNDTFLWSVILWFCGIGQITAGFLEYLKCRAFPAIVYITLGFYCLSHYAYYVIPKHMDLWQNQQLIYPLEPKSICCFYSAWVVIGFGLLLISFRSNVLYVLQLATCVIFFLLRAIGEGTGSLGCKRNAAGILEVISGFFSLFVAFSQILNNETCFRYCFPSCPLSPDNEIDVYGGPLAAPYTPYAPVPVVPVGPVSPVLPTGPIITGNQFIPIVGDTPVGPATPVLPLQGAPAVTQAALVPAVAV